VTILGIFTAIMVGIFGGMEIIGNVMNNINNVSTPKLLMFSSLLIGSIITIIYLLLLSVAGMTGKVLRNCGCDNNVNCKHTIFKKHPIYITGMVTSLYLFLIGAASN